MKIIGKIPEVVYLACSGGKDSMAVLNFLLHGGRTVHLVHFNHGTKHGDEAAEQLSRWHFRYQTIINSQVYGQLGNFMHGSVVNPPRKGQSLEDYWRIERYRFFNEISDKYNCDIMTAHHLDDVVETYLVSCMNGSDRLIRHKWKTIYRPFLFATSKELHDLWDKRSKRDSMAFHIKKMLSFHIDDPSNYSDRFQRSRLRKLVPELHKISPSLYSTVKKKLKERMD